MVKPQATETLYLMHLILKMNPTNQKKYWRTNLRYLQVFLLVLILSCKQKEGNYVCTPCELECDELVFNAPGTCPHCGMDLIAIADIDAEEKLVLNEINIQKGSGFFLVEGGKGNTEKEIKVFYHQPESFSKDTSVLLVIPGAGRDADEYRDAWIEESEKHNALILSPQYPEKTYPFEAYHLGGVIGSSNLAEKVTFNEGTNQVHLDEEGLVFETNQAWDTYIFNDFDRIFDLVKTEMELTTEGYDAFGHSAGGHVLHRMALLHPNSKAQKIYASNASFYTLPDFDIPYPFGLKGTSLNKEQLGKAFKQQLVVLLGEEDNDTETKGTFLRSNTADKQGLHRLSRGKNFFERAQEIAKELDHDFNWQLQVIPNVGHNHKLMGQAAGPSLYDNK